ncbi:MAG: hypothetical protein JXA06_04160 [Bacteroidetes bacterium]|nr:hypothetical protein [Bacteroidota bacterium]
MRSIISYRDYTLSLQQPSAWKAFYEVRFGDEILGTINIHRKLNRHTVAISADGTWIFEYYGLVNPKIFAKDQNNDIIAEYIPRPLNNRGAIRIAEQELEIKLGILKNTFDLYLKNDIHAIHFEYRGLLRFQSDINIYRASSNIKQLPLVFFFCCFILLTNRRKSAK